MILVHSFRIGTVLCYMVKQCNVPLLWVYQSFCDSLFCVPIWVSTSIKSIFKFEYNYVHLLFCIECSACKRQCGVPTYKYINENYIIIKARMLRVSIPPLPHGVSLLNVRTRQTCIDILWYCWMKYSVFTYTWVLSKRFIF